MTDKTPEAGKPAPAAEPLALRLSDQLGMRFGVRYVVTRNSKNREFQTGDRVWMEPDGSIMCQAAHGWMPPEDVIEATEGWAIEPDANWAAAMRADLERQLAALPHAQRRVDLQTRLAGAVRSDDGLGVGGACDQGLRTKEKAMAWQYTVKHYWTPRERKTYPWPCEPHPGRTTELWPGDVLTPNGRGGYTKHNGVCQTNLQVPTADLAEVREPLDLHVGAVTAL